MRKEQGNHLVYSANTLIAKSISLPEQVSLSNKKPLACFGEGTSVFYLVMGMASLVASRSSHRWERASGGCRGKGFVPVSCSGVIGFPLLSGFFSSSEDDHKGSEEGERGQGDRPAQEEGSEAGPHPEEEPEEAGAVPEEWG